MIAACARVWLVRKACLFCGDVASNCCTGISVGTKRVIVCSKFWKSSVKADEGARPVSLNKHASVMQGIQTTYDDPSSLIVD